MFFSSGRKNASINDLAPIFARILLEMKFDGSGHFVDQGHILLVVRSEIQETDFELSEKYLRDVSKLLFGTLSVINNSRLLNGLVREARLLPDEATLDGRLSHVFDSKSDFQDKFHELITAFVAAQMVSAEL